jgi:hypothetical protein
VVIIHGEADENVPPEHARYYHDHIGGSTLQLVPGEGHMSIVLKEPEWLVWCCRGLWDPSMLPDILRAFPAASSSCSSSGDNEEGEAAVAEPLLQHTASTSKTGEALKTIETRVDFEVKAPQSSR